ncbi:MAG: cation diffusion facilitator family transporter [Ruminococcus bromii]|nr:cation diffusion facilitator family transporter [Ruminococcus bromii]MCI7210985.1 cation diffusion facilitator family transporter [Ruminococcus bromii]MDD6434171.1 cation diffusion facilitator family transporter [Ruminococcus bromii]MDY4084832.1 cation diffusion facilitator family transporter [Ruminococcus bromii]MDY4711519.1 cation diffusion facilitator family transporter [Ruminococcus bromii]
MADKKTTDIVTPQFRREKVIVRTSIVGIVTNVLLVVFKSAVGLLSNSIAIVLDAVNNLSDVLSSLITIVGAKLAGRMPDKGHPLGHGRIEYISAMMVAAIVLYAGFTAFVESVKKIFNPVQPDYSPMTLIVVTSAVIVKIILGLFVQRNGKKVNSTTLTASGIDALFDAVISASVLLSAIIYLLTGVCLEAYLGIVISAFVIRPGYKLMKSTLNEILGKRISRDLLSEIKQTICEDDCVFGAYDLILHCYGTDNYIGSVNVEIPDVMTADEIDTMERRIADKVYKKHGVILASIGIYSMNTTNDEIKKMRTDISHIVMSHDNVLQIHGFYVNLKEKSICFDIIIDYDSNDRDKMYSHIYNEIQSHYPDFSLKIDMDIDI